MVWQCVQAQLVDGSKIFVDSSLIDANAAKSSMVERESLRYQLDKRYPELERRLTEVDQSLPAGGRGTDDRLNRSWPSPNDTCPSGRPRNSISC